MGLKTPLHERKTVDDMDEKSQWFCWNYLLLSNSKNFEGRITASEIGSFLNIYSDISMKESFYRVVTGIDIKLNKEI